MNFGTYLSDYMFKIYKVKICKKKRAFALNFNNYLPLTAFTMASKITAPITPTIISGTNLPLE